MRTLLLGAARCGKSSLAMRWAHERSHEVCCVVTGIASDAEMSVRIGAHRQERPKHWRVREEPVRLAAALRAETRTNVLLLVDCLTLWTSNCLWPPGRGAVDAQPDLSGWRAECEEFLATLRASSNDVIIVSNEVGTGIVPDNAAARVFRDEHGWLNQAVAAVCEQVFLVTAGLPLRLK